MTVLTRRVIMIIRPMVTILAAIPLPAAYLQPSRRKETAPRTEKSRLKVDKVVVHEIEDYYQLPDGQN